jgi:hypothetical protein
VRPSIFSDLQNEHQQTLQPFPFTLNAALTLAGAGPNIIPTTAAQHGAPPGMD